MARVVLPRGEATRRFLKRLPSEIDAIRAEKEKEKEEKRQQFLSTIKKKALTQARIAELQAELEQLKKHES